MSTLITRTSVINSAATQLNVFSNGVFSLKNTIQPFTVFPAPKTSSQTLSHVHLCPINSSHLSQTMTPSNFHPRPKAYWRCHRAMHRLNVILLTAAICFILNLTHVVVTRSTLKLFTTQSTSRPFLIKTLTTNDPK